MAPKAAEITERNRLVPPAFDLPMTQTTLYVAHTDIEFVPELLTGRAEVLFL